MNTNRSFRWMLAGLCAIAVTVGIVRISRAQDGKELRDKFQEVNLNGDGSIIADELPNPVLFKKLDADGDGKITMDEAKQAFRSGVLTKEMIKSETAHSSRASARFAGNQRLEAIGEATEAIGAWGWPLRS